MPPEIILQKIPSFPQERGRGRLILLVIIREIGNRQQGNALLEVLLIFYEYSATVGIFMLWSPVSEG